jgi:hypothetical protein
VRGVLSKFVTVFFALRTTVSIAMASASSSVSSVVVHSIPDCVLEPVWIQVQPDEDTELSEREKNELVEQWNHAGQLRTLTPATEATGALHGESCLCHPHVVRVSHSKLHEWEVNDMVEMHLAVDEASLTATERRERETWYKPFGRIQKLYTIWFRDDDKATVFQLPATRSEDAASDDDEEDDGETLQSQWVEVRYGYFGADIDRCLHARLKQIMGKPVRRQTMFWSTHEQALPVSCLTRTSTHDEDFQTRINSVEWTYQADTAGFALESGKWSKATLLTRERPVEFSGNGRRLGSVLPVAPVAAEDPKPDGTEEEDSASVFARELLADIKEPLPVPVSTERRKRRRANQDESDGEDAEDEAYDPAQDDMELDRDNGEEDEEQEEEDRQSTASSMDEDRPILDMLPSIVARRRPAKMAKRDNSPPSSKPMTVAGDDGGPVFCDAPLFGGRQFAHSSSSTATASTFESRFQQFVQFDDAFLFDTAFWTQDILPVLCTLANCNNNLPHVWSHLWKTRFNLALNDSFGRRNWCGESTCFFCKQKQPLTSEYVDAETGLTHPVGSVCASAVRAAMDVMHDMRQFRKQARNVARAQSNVARAANRTLPSTVAIESSFQRPLLSNANCWDQLYEQVRRTLQAARDVRAQ